VLFSSRCLWLRRLKGLRSGITFPPFFSSGLFLEVCSVDSLRPVRPLLPFFPICCKGYTAGRRGFWMPIPFFFFFPATIVIREFGLPIPFSFFFLPQGKRVVSVSLPFPPSFPNCQIGVFEPLRFPFPFSPLPSSCNLKKEWGPSPFQANKDEFFTLLLSTPPFCLRMIASRDLPFFFRCR